MESDVETLLKFSIDIDSIKDEQNPMYQNVNIQRQRLISVLDRALEKVGIAYVLDDLLSKNVSVLKNYTTQQELDSILRLYRYAQRLEDGEDLLRSTIMRRTALFKSFSSRTRSSEAINKFRMSTSPSSVMLMQMDSEKYQEGEKGSALQWQLVRSYYSSVIAKLHFVPEITAFAKYLIYKKPIGSIKYYIYLKDLRNFVMNIIYHTKTDEVNYEKKIKQAYVKNLKVKPQVEAIKKVFQEKLKDKDDLEQQIRKDIQNEGLIQAQMNKQLICVANEMINISEAKIKRRTQNHNLNKDLYEAKLAERTAFYNKQLDENLAAIKVLRKRVKKLEVTFRKIMDNYDNTMGALHEDYEVTNESYLKIHALYTELKEKFDIQEEKYIEVMAEKKEYVEMTCLRIRYNKGAKIIQHWWRDILCRKWKTRKTYIATQLKRKTLVPAQRAKLQKILKKIMKLQKGIKNKWK